MSFKWNLVALTVSLGASQLASAAGVEDQATAKGFVEGSSLNLLLRNFYFDRDGKNSAGDKQDWLQVIQGNFSSGFTQGTIGFGVDAYGYWGVKLDGGKGNAGSGNLPVDSNGGRRMTSAVQARRSRHGSPRLNCIMATCSPTTRSWPRRVLAPRLKQRLASTC